MEAACVVDFGPNVLLSIIVFMNEYKKPINRRLLKHRVKKRSEKLLSIASDRRLYDTIIETRPVIFYHLHLDPFSKNRTKNTKKKREKKEKLLWVSLFCFWGSLSEKFLFHEEKTNNLE